MKETSKKEIDTIIEAIEDKFNPVKSKEDSRIKRSTIVLLSMDCSRKHFTTIPFVNAELAQHDLMCRISDLTAKGHSQFRVIKGEEIDYPFEI